MPLYRLLKCARVIFFRECNYSYNFHHGVAVNSIHAYNTDGEYS